MNQFKAVLAFILLIAALMFSQSWALAEFVYPPHEDPAVASEEMDAYFFLKHYTSILTLISTKDYADANKLIEQLRFVYIPEDLRYIIQRYNNLTSELTETLERLDKLLSNASALIYQYRLQEAHEKLSEASILLGKAERATVVNM